VGLGDLARVGRIRFTGSKRDGNVGKGLTKKVTRGSKWAVEKSAGFEGGTRSEGEARQDFRKSLMRIRSYILEHVSEGLLMEERLNPLGWFFFGS
jgi:hypothetical protein